MRVEIARDVRSALRQALHAASHREIGGVLMGEQIEPGHFRIVDLSIDDETGDIRIVIPTENGSFLFSWDTTGGAATLSWAVLLVATAIVLLGAALVIGEYRRENRQKVVVIEARRLRDWAGEPLEKAVPITFRGRRDPVSVDVRQGLVDGQIVDPDRALRRLSSLPDDVARRVGGQNRADISFVLGGLAPIPYLFLLGVIVDDEHRTLFMDWDRNRHVWRPLDEDDDGRRFNFTGLDAIPTGATRAALCISVSYDVLDADVRLVERSVRLSMIAAVGSAGRPAARRRTARKSSTSASKQPADSQRCADTPPPRMAGRSASSATARPSSRYSAGH